MLHKYENAVIVSSYSNLTVPAHDLLNANTFPDAAKTQCETARKRLEMFLYFSSIVPAVMERSTIQLQHFVELLRLRSRMERLFPLLGKAMTQK